MKYTSLILCTFVAAVLCVASIIFMAKEISIVSQSESTLSSTRQVNFTFASGRNFDELANALVSYRDCRATPEVLPVDASNKQYIEKFDVVWSAYKVAFRNVYSELTSTSDRFSESRALRGQQLRDQGVAFVDKYEADMTPTSSINCSRINEMLVDIYSQKEQINEFAQSDFELDNRAARDQQKTIGNIINTVAVLGLSFLLVASITILLVYKALKHASQSLAKSKSAEEQAQTALRDLRDSKDQNLAQKQFFAAASHDLRQPLHALGLYIGSLQRHMKSDEATHILKCASLSAESLSALIDSLLDISKLDAGVISVNRDEFEVADLLSRLHDRFLPEVEEKGLVFILEADDSIIYTDEQLLDRMLQNLISNAIAYTKSGQIKLACDCVGSDVLITVSDTGQGIPDHKQQIVFEEFYRVDDGFRDRDRGLGLGLSIVKRLGALLQVSIALESHDGIGTIFTIRMPSVVFKREDTKEYKTPSQQPIMLQNHRVLVIDDEEEVRESTALVLESRGCVVLAVENAEAARVVCAAGEFKPDVVVSDYRLRSDENGMDAINLVRQTVGREVPALLITGDTTINYATRREMACFEVLYKPVDTRLLCERIAKVSGNADCSNQV